MVVSLTHPVYDNASRTLSFTATREARTHDPAEKGLNWQRITTPASMSSVGLFIDDATGDTTGPTVTAGYWECDQTQVNVGNQCTQSFTVTDPSMVATVGGLTSIGPCRGPIQVTTQGLSTSTVTVNVTVTLNTCASQVGTMSFALSSTTDALGNTTSNASLGVIALGIV